MLMSPSSLLARLDELKKWQQVQQERLMRQQQNHLEQTENNSESESIQTEGVSVLKSCETTPAKTKHEETNHFSPVNDFTSLLEEKLQEDIVPNSGKPKRPFLRKGSGLSRYRMVPGDPRKAFVKGKVQQIPRKVTKSVSKTNDTKKVEKPVPALKVPQMDFKPKARWRSVSEEAAEKECTRQDSVITSFNQDIIEQINRLTEERLIDNNKNNVLEPLMKNCESYSEKELLKFEALENRALNSSFCSTNSSVIRLMASTPQKTSPQSIKPKNVQFREYNDEIIQTPTQYNLEHISETPTEINESELIEQLIYKQMQEGTLQDFLQKLRHLKQNSHEGYFKSDDSCPQQEMRSVSSCSSVNSEDIRNCIADAGKQNENDCWSAPESNVDEDETTAVNNSVSTEDTNTQIHIIVKDAATNTDRFLDETDIEEKNKVLKNDSCENLLMAKIKELEEQIGKIRLENSKVANIRKELEMEQSNFKKDKKQLLQELEDEKMNVKYTLEEERKKLAKEKMVFERYVKDLQNKPSKQERSELSNLRIELANVKETQKLKDTKNSMTQARLRNQIKSLEKENANLKEEVEKLTKQNARLVAAQKVTGRKNDTKMLQEINRNVTKLTREKQQTKKKHDESDSEKESVKKLDRSSKTNVSKTKDDSSCHGKDTEETNDCSGSNDISDSWFYGRSVKENNRNLANIDIEKSYEQVFGRISTDGKRHSNESADRSKRSLDKIETALPDGSKETRYTNGNVKVTSPDGNVIKTKYYNGDIKETDLLKGQIKYFYFETNTWQTTFADGTEILEFPNGQMEKKFKDGTLEVKLPDGVVKTTKQDGTQEIAYLDGSVVVINSEGDRTLLLPNGQREVHTKEHKRREYPDGTVKILYPDGIQETRYANGRIRVKDKEGNLLMDSFS